ncbi:MAG: PIG-L family deacetylase [Flavobacteriaceae bacterium]
MKKKVLKKFCFILMLIVITAVFFIINNYRKSAYYYKTDSDYTYNFDFSNAKYFHLKLKDNRIIIPDSLNLFNTTSFIKLNLNTNLKSNFFRPEIKIYNDKNIINQFEIGAKGIRYINISNLTNDNGKELIIESKNISVDDQEVELIIFNNVNVNVKDSKILVIAPHPDDAEIASYGLYSTNNDTFILTITAGEAGINTYDEIYKDSTEQYLQKGKLRTWNSITVPLLGGISIENCINLGFFDGTLKTMYENRNKDIEGLYTKTNNINTFRKYNVSKLQTYLKGSSSWISLVENIRVLLDTIKPELIITPYPVIDSNSDHKFTTVALLEALKGKNIRNGRLLLYTNHHSKSEFFPFGNSGYGITLPPNFNDSLYFNSIYSIPLSTTIQNDKMFALEAMNDLRLDTEWLNAKGSAKITSEIFLRKILAKDKDYFRRAVRSNELFFVVDINKIYDKDVYDLLVKTTE